MDRSTEIVLIHFHTKEIESYGKLSLINHKDYCQKNNYTWTVFDKKADQRHPSWSRIQFILECFDQGFKWVFWIDPDAWVMNKHFKLEKLIDDNYNIILSKESGSMNLGVAMWKNCDENITLLERMDLSEQFYNDTWLEQRAFLHIVNKELTLKSKIQILPDKIFQGSINGDFNDMFVLHLPGTTTEERTRIFNEFIRDGR